MPLGESPLREFSDGSGSLDADYGPEVASGRDSDRDDRSHSDQRSDGSHDSRVERGRRTVGLNSQQNTFPTRDYVMVTEGLCRHPNWMVYPRQMANCLASAVEIAGTGDEEGERRLEELTRLYREVTPSFFEKCVVADDVRGWEQGIQADILLCCKALSELVAVKVSQALVLSERNGDMNDVDRRNSSANLAEQGSKEEEKTDTPPSRHDSTPEESDALCLLNSLACVFDRTSPFHSKNKWERVPRLHRGYDMLDGVQRYAHAGRGAGTPTNNFTENNFNLQNDGVLDITNSKDGRDGNAWDDTRYDTRYENSYDRYDKEYEEKYQWLGFLVDVFGSNGGFDSVCDALLKSEKVSWALLDAAGQCAARGAEEVNEKTLSDIVHATGIALQRCSELASKASNSEGVAGVSSKVSTDATENGTKTKKTEKPKLSVSTFLQISSFLKSARVVLQLGLGDVEAERRVSETHRLVVESLLELNTFNAQLSAVREINQMLTNVKGAESGLSSGEAADVAGDAMRWIDAKNVVHKTLAPHFLHHKQYVDQLALMLRQLCQDQGLANGHLDMLWQIVQRPDAFEDTKKNVLELLAKIAQFFSSSQLDFLFSKIELKFSGKRDVDQSTEGTSGGLPVPSSTSDEIDDLLLMVQKLARSDSSGNAAERTLTLLWRAAREVSIRETHEISCGRNENETDRLSTADRTTAVFASVLSHYNGLGVECASVSTWTLKCLQEITHATDGRDIAAAARVFKAVASLEISSIDADTENGTPVLTRKKKRRHNAERDKLERDQRRGLRLRELDRNSHVVETLVQALERFQNQRGTVLDDSSKPTTSTSQNGSKSSSQPLGFGTAAGDLTLNTIVEVLLFTLKDGEIEVGPVVGKRVWRALVEVPSENFQRENSNDCEIDAATQLMTQKSQKSAAHGWMTHLLMVPPRVMSPACVTTLLKDCIIKQPAHEMTLTGWFLFCGYFLQVSLDCKKLAPSKRVDRVYPEDDTTEGRITNPRLSVDDNHVIDIDIDDAGDVTGVQRNDAGTQSTQSPIKQSDDVVDEIVDMQPAPFLSTIAADTLETTETCDLGGNCDSFLGFEHLWDIALNAPRDDRSGPSTYDSRVGDIAIEQLIQLHVQLASGDDAREAIARTSFLRTTLEHLRRAASGISSISKTGVNGDVNPSSTTQSEQRASRCLLLLSRFIESCEAADPPAGGASLKTDALPHGGSYRGFPVEMEITVVSAGDVREGPTLNLPISAHSNATVRWVKEQVALAIRDAQTKAKESRNGTGWVGSKNVRLVLGGRDLGRSDDETLNQSLRRSDIVEGVVRAHALLHRSDARSEVDRHTQIVTNADGGETNERLPRALLFTRGETYDVLFELADCECAVVRARAQELLVVLPTRQVVRSELMELLGGDSNNNTSSNTSTEAKRNRLQALFSSSPARGVYALQALDGLLTPPDVGRDMMRAKRPDEDNDTPDDDMDITQGEDCDGDTDVDNSSITLALAFRKSFMSAGYARDVLALLPKGVDGPTVDNGSVRFELPTAHMAWRDLGLRRATVASALSVLRVALDAEDNASDKALALDMAPSLATLARAFAPESDLQNENEHLAKISIKMFFMCAGKSVCENEVPTCVLLRMSCFPSTLRDVLVCANNQSARRAFFFAAVRATYWRAPDSLENGETDQSQRKQGVLRPPPGFADVVLSVLPDAEQRPQRCREYFALLGSLLKAPVEHETENSQEKEANARLDAAAADLFVAEVNAISVCPPEMSDGDSDPRLLARMDLMFVLLERLIGAEKQRGSEKQSASQKLASQKLIRVLLFRCLFPEAGPLLRPSGEVLADAGMLVPASADGEQDKAEESQSSDSKFFKTFGVTSSTQISETHLTPVCRSSGSRRAAFKLLGLMVSSGIDSNDEVVSLINALHHPGSLDTSLQLTGDGRDKNNSSKKESQSHRPYLGYVGLKNAGATCYMNAVFQQLFMIPKLRNDILQVVSTCTTEDEKNNSVFHQLQKTFASLSLSKLDHFAPSGFWRAFKDYDGEPINVREHQDCLEFFGRLQDMVDNEYKRAVEVMRDTAANGASNAVSEDAQNHSPNPPKIKGAVESSMGGKFVNQVISKTCPHRSERMEDFVHVSVDVRGKANLVESLQSYVSGELLESDNAWFCEQCGSKKDAVKRSCFVGCELPQTLCVHLKRFEFDYESMQRLKIKSRFEFPNTLDMAPFTVEAMDGAGGGGEGDTKSDPMQSDPIEKPSSKQSSKSLYRLAGVVVHSGTAFAGHYYSMIRERDVPVGVDLNSADLTYEYPDLGNRWHIYDDQNVNPYNVDNLPSDAFGGTYTVDFKITGGKEKAYDRPNSAYMLFYEKVGVDTVDQVSPVTVITFDTGTLDGDSPAIDLSKQRLISIPPSVRLSVMRENLKFAYDVNVHDAEYFAFYKGLVMSVLKLGKVGGGGQIEGLNGSAQAELAGRHKRSSSLDVGTKQAKNVTRKARRTRRSDTPGGGSLGEDEQSDSDDDARVGRPRVRSMRATQAVQLAVDFLCRTYLNAPFAVRDAETLCKWHDFVNSLVRDSPAAQLWVLRWVQQHSSVLELALGKSLKPEARDIVSAVVSAAVGAPTALAGLETRNARGDEIDLTIDETSRLVDVVIRDVARAVSAAAEDRDLDRGAASSWYFCILHAYVFGGDGGGDCVNLQLNRVHRLSRLDILAPLVECAKTLCTKQGRRKEILKFDTSGKECVSMVWSLLCVMLRASDTTQARRVFARRCALRAHAVLGVDVSNGLRLGDGFHVHDLACDGEWSTEGEADGVKCIPDTDADDAVIGRIAGQNPSPYAPQVSNTTKDDKTSIIKTPRLSLDAFHATLDFEFITNLVHRACACGSGVRGQNARAVLCHLSWRWDTMSYIIATLVIEKLNDKCTDADEVVATLRTCEALLRIEDGSFFSKTRCGYLLEGKTYRHPHAFPTADGAVADGALPPYMRIALASVFQRNQDQFPSGVIECAAFDVCGREKRFVIARWLVKVADPLNDESIDEGNDSSAKRALQSITNQHEDFQYVVNGFADIAVDPYEPAAASEDEEERDNILRIGKRDDTLDDPAVVLQRAEALLARVTTE